MYERGRFKIEGLSRYAIDLRRYATYYQKVILESLQDVAIHYFRELVNLVTYSEYSEKELRDFPHPLAKKRWSQPMWIIPTGGVQTVTGEMLESLRLEKIEGGSGYWVGWEENKQPDYLVYIYDGTKFMFPRKFLEVAYDKTDYDDMFFKILDEKTIEFENFN